MRSRDADRYDLDADAVDYDTRVADEQVLIRRGYAACLRALSEDLSRAPTPDGPTPDSPTSDALPVTDLGAGTGTLLRALPASCTAVAVDRSRAMLDQASAKLAGRPVTFIHDDLLAYVTESDTPLGHVVSTFALHSLLPDEKSALLTSLAARLAPGARLCIGDLGFADADSRERFLARADAMTHVSESAARQYFWDWSTAEHTLRALGFRVRRRTHGPLVGSLIAVRDAEPKPEPEPAH